MSITLFQTADPIHYREMLEATSRTAIEFCRRHGHRYESYVGIKRGVHPWQATFNRMFQYQELVARGFDGWGVYLDADAYVHDLDFDLAAYLADKRDRAAVLVSIDPVNEPWNINAGVTLINLGHKLGRKLVAGWLDRYMAQTDRWLADTVHWPDDINDQSMLYLTLSGDVALREAVHYESPTLINSDNARFIRQKLRVYFPDQAERTRAIKLMVSQVLGDAGLDENPAGLLAPVVVSAAYRALLRRDADVGGLTDASNHIRSVGLEHGVENVLTAMANSPEYRALRAKQEG